MESRHRCFNDTNKTSILTGIQKAKAFDTIQEDLKSWRNTYEQYFPEVDVSEELDQLWVYFNSAYNVEQNAENALEEIYTKVTEACDNHSATLETIDENITMYNSLVVNLSNQISQYGFSDSFDVDAFKLDNLVALSRMIYIKNNKDGKIDESDLKNDLTNLLGVLGLGDEIGVLLVEILGNPETYKKLKDEIDNIGKNGATAENWEKLWEVLKKAGISATPTASTSSTVMLVFYVMSKMSNLSDSFIQEQYEKNCKAWDKNYKKYTDADGYIIYQENIKEMFYGKNKKGEQYYGWYNTCEIIATYNALKSANGGTSPVSFAELIKQYSKNGVCCNGNFGTSPEAINSLLNDYGYSTKMLTKGTATTKNVKKLQNNYDSFIITVFNDKNDASKGVHTMSIIKIKNSDGSTTYRLLNDYSKDSKGNTVGYTDASSVDEILKKCCADEELIDIIGVKK